MSTEHISSFFLYVYTLAEFSLGCRSKNAVYQKNLELYHTYLLALSKKLE